MLSQTSIQSSDNNIPISLSNPKSRFNLPPESFWVREARNSILFPKPGSEVTNPIFLSDEESTSRSSSIDSLARAGSEARNPILLSDRESIDQSSTRSRSSSIDSLLEAGREARNPILLSDRESIDQSSTRSRSSSIDSLLEARREAENPDQNSTGTPSSSMSCSSQREAGDMKATVDATPCCSVGQESGRESPTIQESDGEHAISNRDYDCPAQSRVLATSVPAKATKLSSRCRGRPRLQLETFALGGTLCQLLSAKPVADGMYELSIRATISADDLSRLVPSAVTNGQNRKKRKIRGIEGMRQSRRTRKRGPIETQAKGDSAHETEPEDLAD